MEARRSTRKSIVLPVLLSGIDLDGLTFNENTWTIGVNRHGAKLSTSYRLAVGDQITLSNPLKGRSARARVVRVLEKGRGFEIGVELTEQEDVWGAEVETADSGNGDALPEVGQSLEQAAEPPPVGQATPIHVPAAAHASEAGQAVATPEATAKKQPVAPPVPNNSDSSTSPQEPPPRRGEKHEVVGSFQAHFDSLEEFLQASRAELQNLLAKTQEIQQGGWRTLQTLFGEVHTRFQQELEAASASFVDDTRKRVQHEASAALEIFGQEVSSRQAALAVDAQAKAQAARQQIDLSFREGAEEFQKRLGELSASALEEFRCRGQAFFGELRVELQKSLEELKKKSMEEISDQLRAASTELADEIRRRADVGFEILNEQLTRSGRSVVEETQKQLTTLHQSALAALATEASGIVREHLDSGARLLEDAAHQTKSNLEADLQLSVEAFRQRADDLCKGILEENRKTSESLLRDLHSRLDQAARALRQMGAGVAGGSSMPPTS